MNVEYEEISLVLFISHWLNTLYICIYTHTYIVRELDIDRFNIVYDVRYVAILRLGTLDTAGGKDAGEALLVRAVHLVLGAATGRRREKNGKKECICIWICLSFLY